MVSSPILTPEAPEIALPWFYPSEETEAEQERILKSRFFLVRIAGNGDVWRCGRCGGKHEYLTLMCVPQPFSGLSRGLFAYWKTVGAHGAEQHLPPAERSRLKDLDRMFAATNGLPDLATSHPETVRSLQVAERDADIGAYSFVAVKPGPTALGLVEPIARVRALKLAERINLRGIKPAFVLEGVS